MIVARSQDAVGRRANDGVLLATKTGRQLDATALHDWYDNAAMREGENDLETVTTSSGFIAFSSIRRTSRHFSDESSATFDEAVRKQGAAKTT